MVVLQDAIGPVPSTGGGEVGDLVHVAIMVVLAA